MRRLNFLKSIFATPIAFVLPKEEPEEKYAQGDYELRVWYNGEWKYIITPNDKFWATKNINYLATYHSAT